MVGLGLTVAMRLSSSIGPWQPRVCLLFLALIELKTVLTVRSSCVSLREPFPLAYLFGRSRKHVSLTLVTGSRAWVPRCTFDYLILG